ncbi:MAG: hypothetical protein KDD55_02110 [Bdellovibrionales bacterium]|nr:hypothetical protein [Bdellovibrionales bacterium]
MMYQERNGDGPASSTPPTNPSVSSHAKDLAAIEQAVADRRWKDADDAAWRILNENGVDRFPTLKNSTPSDFRGSLPVERRSAVAVAVSQIGRSYINSNRGHGDSYELHAALCFEHGLALDPYNLAIAVDLTHVAAHLSDSTVRSYCKRGEIGFPSSKEFARQLSTPLSTFLSILSIWGSNRLKMVLHFQILNQEGCALRLAHA